MGREQAITYWLLSMEKCVYRRKLHLPILPAVRATESGATCIEREVVCGHPCDSTVVASHCGRIEKKTHFYYYCHAVTFTI